MSTGAISFQVLAEIAVGDTARVDLCRATSGPRAGQLLAVKRLHPHIAEEPAFANQFMDEVWMTAALRHPNVVEVAGWGNDEQGMYLAVELVQGVSLARLMKTVFETGEMFTERMVVFIAERLCRGLSMAHKLRGPDGQLLNLVHRDLSPGNVLIGFNGDVKIADFSLAKAKLRLTQTVTGVLKGLPQYMSPEQARGGRQIDGRSDLFALGVLLFELFAGRAPWVASTEYEMVQVALTQPPGDLRELRPKIDKELVAIVSKCLEKDPAARFQSADEVLARLDNWLETHGYLEGNEDSLARFVRRNAMRQMRWFERAVAGEMVPAFADGPAPTGGSFPQRPAIPVHSVITSAPILQMHALGVGPSGPARLPGQPAAFESPESETLPKMLESAKGQAARVKPRPGPDARAGGVPVNESDAVSEDDFEEEEMATVVQSSAPMIPRPPSAGLGDPSLKGLRSTQPMTRGQQGVPQGGASKPPPAPPPPTSASLMDDEVASEDLPTKPLRAEMLAARMATHRAQQERAVQAAGQGAGGLPGVVVSAARGMPPPPVPASALPAAPPHSPGAQLAAASAAPHAVAAPHAAPHAGAVAHPGAVAHAGAGAHAGAVAHAGAHAGAYIPQEAPPRSQGARNEARRTEETARDAPQAREAIRQVTAAGGASQLPFPESGITREVLRAEADRIVFAAARIGEDARVAAEIAERKAAVVKLADRAASIAAEAVSLVSSAGLPEAARRFEEARALDRQIQQELALIATIEPPPPVSTRGQAFAAPPASTRTPGGFPAPVIPAQPPVVPPPQAAAGPAAWPGAGGASPRSPGVAPDFSDDLAARLRPKLFGLPQPLGLAVVAGGILLLIVVFWLAFG